MERPGRRRGSAAILFLALPFGCGARNDLAIAAGVGGGDSTATGTTGSGGSIASSSSSSSGPVDCPITSQTLLATQQDGLGSIVVLGDEVFFRTQGEVRKVSKCGGAITTVAKASGFDLTASPRGVFWDSSLGTSMRLEWNPAGKSDVVVLATVTQAQGELWRPAADEDSAYWVLRPHGENVGGIMRNRLDVTPLAVETLSPIGGAYAYVGPLVSSGDRLYFQRGDATSPFGPLMVFEKNGSLAQDLGDSPSPERMAADETGLYMTFAHSIDEVRRFEPATSTWTTLASGVQAPVAIAVDEANAYFTVTGGGLGRVSWVPKGGGVVTDLLEGQGDAEGIAVDADSVYFTSRGERTVVRVPKP